MTPQTAPEAGDEVAKKSLPPSRRAVIPEQFERLVTAIRTGDDAMVERSVLALSQRSRWLAPLALLVGAFAMLFQGVRLIFSNWRLTLVQILPAMWIWAAMLDLKAHALHGKEFHLLRGPLLWLVLLVIAGLTAGSFFLNSVFTRSPYPNQEHPRFVLPSPKRNNTSARSSPGACSSDWHWDSPPWLSIAGESCGSPSR